MQRVVEYALSPFLFLYNLVAFKARGLTAMITIIVNIVILVMLLYLGAEDRTLALLLVGAYMLGLVQYNEIRQRGGFGTDSVNELVAYITSLFVFSSLLILLL